MNTPRLNASQSAYLDFLRGIAAQIVLLGHASILFLNGSSLYHADLQVGAVMAFFLLSGFLISYTVFRRYNDSSFNFRHYFIDRFARIFTAFIPALVFVALLDAYSLSLPAAEWLRTAPPENGFGAVEWTKGLFHNYSLQYWLGNVLMLQEFPLFQIARLAGIEENSFFIKSFGSASPFWTISIEWWLYMLFGMVILLRIRTGKPFKWWQIGALGFVSIEPMYYLIGGVNNCLSLLWIMGMLTCLVFLNQDRLLEQLKWQTDSRKITAYSVLIFLFALACMAGRLLAIRIDTGRFEFNELQFGLFMTIAMFAPLFVLRNTDRIPALVSRSCNWVAGYSFSLYLIHAPILTCIYLQFSDGTPNWRLMVASFAISNASAIVFAWLFERHYHKVAAFLKSGIMTQRNYPDRARLAS